MRIRDTSGLSREQPTNSDSLANVFGSHCEPTRVTKCLVRVRWGVAGLNLSLRVWQVCHTLDGMKMTLHIDDGLLARVMAASGVESKTKAVDLALREMDRRAELRRLTAEGLGLSAKELKEVYDPASNLADPVSTAKPASYGRKPRSRR